MKAGRSIQEASRLPHGLANRWRVYREGVFAVKLVTLDRPSCGLYLPRPMQHGQASLTAVGAAGHRAAHQVLEHGFVFADPLALRILGQDADEAIALAKERPERRPLRLFIADAQPLRRGFRRAVRSRKARGKSWSWARVSTLSPIDSSRPDDLRVFELDHPATQAEKRRRLTEAQIAEPAHVAYVAHDFEAREHDRRARGRRASTRARRTFVLWLGVTPYLTEEAVFATLGELARLPGGAEVVFDYANPPHAIEETATRDFHRGDGRAGRGERRAVPMLFRLG